MASKMENPASLAADRAPNSFKRAAVNGSEIIEKASSLQEIRAAFVARRCRMSREFAQIIAPLTFGHRR
jgi:hypothetical protein